ncbi:TnsD family Tn7-like transposition protein [Gottfriedia sp. NPDC056225]|uniref:TnsD family Tn7-like transposition protein n=1 Tax=Gottfriedia sp. NPDC056225 TaxID=3345751 RepID=UPI0035E359A6
MLPFFPNPYPGELLDSVLARFHARSGNSHSGQSMKQLVGNEQILFSYDLPSRIDTLVDRIKHVSALDSDIFIHDHTLFPYYAFYGTNDRKNRLRTCMKSDRGEQIPSLAGKGSNKRIQLAHYQFCQACFDKMLEHDGETYWLRIHQTPGVFVCPKHGIPLRVSDVEVRRRSSIRYKHPNTMKTSTTIQLKKEYLPLYLEVAKQIERLYEQYHEKREDYWYIKEYRARMNAHGYVNINQNIEIKQLIKAMEKRYPHDFLKWFELEEIDKWLPRLLYDGAEIINPLPHLLLHIFFEEKKGNEREIEQKPFGNGPWPCLNPAADHVHVATINEVDITIDYGSKLPVGVFCCLCGYTYQRIGPEKTAQERYRFQKVVEYGQIWTDKLLRASELCTMTELKEQFQTSDYTIHTILNAHSKPFQVKAKKRDYAQTDYSSPELFDPIMLENVKREVENLFALESKPTQLTMGYLVKRVKKGQMLYKKLDQMPLTKTYLADKIETREDLERRLIDWAIKQLQQQQLVIKKTQIKKVSGISKWNEPVKQYLNDAMNRLNR